MPTKLPNGLLIFNATSHDLVFQCGKDVVLAEKDMVLNAKITGTVVEEHLNYSLLTNTYEKLESGLKLIEYIRIHWPEALIVGSQIAAQAYPGDVVCPLPISRGRVDSNTIDKSHRPQRSDKFITFRKRNNNG